MGCERLFGFYGVGEVVGGGDWMDINKKKKKDIIQINVGEWVVLTDI